MGVDVRGEARSGGDGRRRRRRLPDARGRERKEMKLWMFLLKSPCLLLKLQFNHFWGFFLQKWRALFNTVDEQYALLLSTVAGALRGREIGQLLYNE